MEIERKFIIKKLPDDLGSYPSRFIEQAYLNTDPVVRIRREDDECYLTWKGRGLMAREEYNLPLNLPSYRHMRSKADGNVISKRRYRIPFGPYTIELDVFCPPFSPLVMAEVEFGDEESANAFLPPDWFGREVTQDPAYHNSNLSTAGRCPDSFFIL